MDHGKRMAWMLVLCFLTAACPGWAQSGGVQGNEVPPVLDAWREFVLHGDERALCPPTGNDVDKRVCLFPARLELVVDKAGAVFSLRSRVFMDTAVTLPHGAGVAVEQVTADGQPAAVVMREGVPVVWLGPGEHMLKGRLGWSAMPASLSVPPDAGAVSLRRDGREMPVALGPDGALRLQGDAVAKQVANTERVTVFRLLRDGVPVTVTTLVRLDVAGLARSVTLPGIVPEGALPLAVRSPVPATFGPDGALVLDAGPGRYEVEVTSRFTGHIGRLGPAVCPFGPEVWSFQDAAALRSVALDGMTAIDPQTTDVPAAWKRFPAVWAKKGQVLTLRELGRGAPSGRDALDVRREFWLDFSGKGLSVVDTVQGENREAWTLSMTSPGALGRVTVAGQDQPVVRLGPEGVSGVELRRSRLSLTARSRYPDAKVALPVGGFDRRFEHVAATVNLPPGWRLLTAVGPDRVSGGLLSGWTLLDVFLAALLTVAAFSLGGPRAGLPLGLYLALSWQAPDAPTLSWLFVLAGVALVRVSGESGRLAGHPGWRRLARWFFGVSVLSVVLLSLGFATTQLRRAVAPQLDGMAASDMVRPQPAMEMDAAAPELAQTQPAVPPAPKRKAARPTVPSAMASGAARENPMGYDPGTLIQTGPATPQWVFKAVSLDWNGPVTPGQTFRLMLVPPWASRSLDVLRVVLLGLALLWCCRLRPAGPVRRAAAVAILAAMTLAAGVSSSLAGGYPSKELLDALHERLTEAPACFPHCLGSSSMTVRLEGERLRLDIVLDAATRTAAPLPAISQGWRPSQVLLDGAPAGALARHGDTLSVLVEPGRHVVTLDGPAPTAVSFTIAPKLAPARVHVTAPGYSVRGLDALGRLRGVLDMVRAQTSETLSAETVAGPTIPDFFQVRRQLDLGLSFVVTTTVLRRSPAPGPAMASVALLPGETPDTPDVTVRDGVAEVAFAPGQKTVTWRSRLPFADRMVLVAPTGDRLVEEWSVAAAPFYDVIYTGPPPVAHLDGAGNLEPRFDPWPEEKLVIGLTRPKPAPGRFVTLERARLVTRQGEHSREASLTMTVRAAKGGRHAVTLPAGAEVTRLAVAGRETPLTGGPGKADFALAPGVTEVQLDFREPVPLGFVTRTPRLDLGLPVANLEEHLELPHDRWLLSVSGATPLGPVVLYWGWLAVVLVVGLGLARLGNTPLRPWQWLCYALGLSQATPLGFVLAVAWLVALGYRRRQPMPNGALAFNSIQLALTLLVLAGFAALYTILETGLLGLPRMQVGGNGSTAAHLVWIFDRGSGTLPACSAVSVPLTVFRLAMLAWAVWLAWALMRWLRWGFVSLTEGGGWKRFRFKMALPARSRPEAGPDDSADNEGQPKA